MSKGIKWILELVAKKLTECDKLEQVEEISIDTKKHTYIKETQHTIFKNNNDSATSAVEHQ